MKYLPLLWSALWRNRTETLLTWSAATAAFILFGLMVGLYVHAQRLVDRQRMDRLWVTMRFPDRPYTGLPASLATQVEQLDGVIAVGAAHWLNGFHREPRDRASVMAVDEGMQRAWPEAPVAAVRARTRELGTLRALGYEPLPLAVSVTVESLFLSLAGAAAGCLIAWALFDGHETASGVVFRWDVSAPIVALGIAWAVALALLGSVPPAIRVARQSVVQVLRE